MDKDGYYRVYIDEKTEPGKAIYYAIEHIVDNCQGDLGVDSGTRFAQWMADKGHWRYWSYSIYSGYQLGLLENDLKDKNVDYKMIIYDVI